MNSLGSKLQIAREFQGLTLEQIASTTRVREHYLKALEEDRFDCLPQKVFAKGFVRSYARSLNLDEEECVQLFMDNSRTFYEKEEKERQRTLERIEGERKGKINRNIVVACTGVILLGLLWGLPREQSAPTPAESEPARDASRSLLERQPQGSTRSQNAPADGADAAQSSESGSPTAEPNPSPPSNAASVPPEDSPGVGSDEFPLLLELRAVETTWVAVRSDEGEQDEVLLQPDEIAQWRAQDRFLLTLGNAGGVTAKLNGRPIGPFGESRVVVRDIELKP